MSPSVHFSANMCMTNRVSRADMSMFCWLFPLIIPIVSILFMIKSQLFYDWTPIKWPISRHSITWMHLSTDLSVVNSPMRLTQREVQKGRQLCPFYYGWLASGFLMGKYTLFDTSKSDDWMVWATPLAAPRLPFVVFSRLPSQLWFFPGSTITRPYLLRPNLGFGDMSFGIITDSCFTREPANTATSCRLLLLFLSFLSFYGFFDSFLHKKVW